MSDSIRRRGAFSLVELLVVMVIITILLGAIFSAGTTLITRARGNKTRATLALVQEAIRAYKSDLDEKPRLMKDRNGAFRKRYGKYPPDEVEVFIKDMPFRLDAPSYSMAVGKVGKRDYVPAPDGVMKFYTAGLAPDEAAQEHRDLAAMVLAIEMLGGVSKDILDRIPDASRADGPLDDMGKPLQFLDRNDNGTYDEEEDLAVRYIVDDWGVPISYMSQRDFDPTKPGGGPSSNHDGWNEASTELIRLNGGQPMLFSYGPDGKKQLSDEGIGSDPTASLVGDFEDVAGGHGIVNNPFNADNVYVDDALTLKLAEGIEQ